MLYRAKYKIVVSAGEKTNPFARLLSERLPVETSLTPEIPEGTPFEMIEEWAKAATPEGYVFVDVGPFSY